MKQILKKSGWYLLFIGLAIGVYQIIDILASVIIAAFIVWFLYNLAQENY